MGADAGTKSVGYWIDLATTADLSVAYMATATIPSAGKTVVWATFTKPTTESVEVGQSDVRVELVGHPEPAWYALDAAGSEFARDEDIGPQQTRYGAVFFGVEPGDYDMRVTREVNGEESAHHCNPLTAWGQPAAGLIRVMTESDHVSRPTIICE